MASFKSLIKSSNPKYSRFIIAINALQFFNSSNLYSIDKDTYANGTNPRKCVRSFRSPETELKRIVHNSLQIEAEVGVGATAGTVTPYLMMRFSNDGGHNWSNELKRTLGAIGKFAQRVAFNRLGIQKEQPRVYELSITSAVKVVLIAAYLS